MKKLIIIGMLLISSYLCNAQNAIYLATQPVDFGLGIRVDYDLFYGSVSHGNYWLNNSHDLYMKNHMKYTIGIMIPLHDYMTHKYNVLVGLNYHTLGKINTGTIDMNPIIFRPISFELGFNVKLKRFCLGMRTDIIRWEPCVDWGWRF